MIYIHISSTPSNSDYLSFVTSSLYQQLTEGSGLPSVFAYMETMPMLMNRTCVFHFQTHHLAQRMHIIIINHRFESTSNAHLVF